MKEPNSLRPKPAAQCEPLEQRRLLASIDVVSVAAGGRSTGNAPSPPEGDGPPAVLSDNGRYVCFSSRATDLVAGLTFSGQGDVFVRDRATGVTRCVSVRDDNDQPMGRVGGFQMSGDGRYVVFSSEGDPGPLVGPNGVVAAPTHRQVYLRDTTFNTTALVSHTNPGDPADGDASGGAISRDGRYVFFSTAAPNLAPAGGEAYVFRLDRETGLTAMVPHAGGGAVPSDDGNVVAFLADDYVLGDFNSDVFVHDFTTGYTRLASATTTGAEVDQQVWYDLHFTLSGDGRTLVFETDVNGVVPGDHNGRYDVFARDLTTGTTSLVSVAPGGGTAPERDARHASVSADGRYVFFDSGANLAGVPGLDPDAQSLTDVYVRDRQTNTTRPVSLDAAGTREAGGSQPRVSADGHSLVYVTRGAGTADDDVPAGPARLVFRDLEAGTSTVLSRAPGGPPVDLGGDDLRPLISRDGNVALIAPSAAAVVPALVPGVADANGGYDLVALQLRAPAAPPRAQAAAADVTTQVQSIAVPLDFVDDEAIDVLHIKPDGVVLTGPNGFRQTGFIRLADPAANQPRVHATAEFAAPRQFFDADDNGQYTVELVDGAVPATSGQPVPAGPVAGGTFSINIPRPDGPDLAALSLVGSLPAITGQKVRAKPLVLTVSNVGNAPAERMGLRLLARGAGGDRTLLESSFDRFSLAPGASRAFHVPVKSFVSASATDLPDGDYTVVASINWFPGPDRSRLNNETSLPTPLHVQWPVTDLAVVSVSAGASTGRRRRMPLLVTLRNEGSAPLKGRVTAEVRLAADPAGPASGTPFPVVLNLNLKPGQSRTVRARVAPPPSVAPGTYFVALAVPSELPGGPDTDPTDNTIFSASAIDL